MPRAVKSSASITIGEQDEWKSNDHFQWQSIKKFVVIAATMSSAVFNFDMFSRVSTNIKLLDFLILESTIGISYLFMDGFIKLYTRRFNCDQYLNPLLKGISYGLFLQTGFFSLIHGSFIADTMRFLVGALAEVPAWSSCGHHVKLNCVSAEEILLRCTKNRTTAFHHTPAFFHYTNDFAYSGGRTMATSRLFVTAIVWIITFFLSSVSEKTTVKIFRSVYVFGTITTIVIVCFLFLATKNEAIAALSQLLNFTSESSWVVSMQHVTYAFGIGYLGIYDFGTISPYTMIDTASVFFVISFTVLAFARSWIVKIMYIKMTKCVIIDASHKITIHKLFYAVLPLSTEFLHVKKLYVLYLFGNLIVTLISLETFLVSTMSKFLYCEIKNVKRIYIVGIVCVFGFGITVIFIAISMSYARKPQFTGERIFGLDILVLYLSGFRVAIIMWLYGVKRFAADIHSWLGFYPTHFWTICWSLLPIALFGFMTDKIFALVQTAHVEQYKLWFWMAVTVTVVIGLQIKTISRYLMRNNIMGLFKASKDYGPPYMEGKQSPASRKLTWRKKCLHNCMIIDDWFDCYHEPLPVQLSSSETSQISDEMKNIYNDADNEKPMNRLLTLQIKDDDNNDLELG